MKLISSLLLAASLSLAAGSAIAACPDSSASAIDQNKTGAIAKDGTRTPLEGAEPGANTVAKDGSTMPLATEEGGGNKDVAISEQDSGARDISPRILSAC